MPLKKVVPVVLAMLVLAFAINMAILGYKPHRSPLAKMVADPDWPIIFRPVVTPAPPTGGSVYDPTNGVGDSGDIIRVHQ